MQDKEAKAIEHLAGSGSNNERLTYDVGTAARLLGVSRNSAYLACLNGQLPCVKVGKRILIPRLRLERWLEGNNSNKAGGDPS